MKNLSVVIPVYNEEAAIEETAAFFKDFARTYPETEIIFVDDGSTDKTKELLTRYIEGTNIHILSHNRQKGYGAALKTGIKYASGKFIAITDADGSYPYQIIPQMYEKMLSEKADMIVGKRENKEIRQEFFRKLGRFILRKFAEYLAEAEIADINSGLRII
ncbi:MAG: hypothetical protein DRQ24_10385, partial [Candidatus Latescibacterota bacterium]